MSLPTLALLLAVTGGGAFAAGRALPSGPAVASVATPAAAPVPEVDEVPEQGELPPGHPPIDDPSSASPGAAGTRVAGPGSMGQAAGAGGTGVGELAWKAPARWQSAPNPSSMRLATYKIPRAPGDAADAELSVTRVGGSIEDNAERWVRQFDAAGQQTAKITTRTFGAVQVRMVEVQGTYSGGMGMGGQGQGPQAGWALLGAIVPTSDSPYFFKMTGPSKSVLAARAELDALLSSLAPRKEQGM